MLIHFEFGVYKRLFSSYNSLYNSIKFKLNNFPPFLYGTYGVLIFEDLLNESPKNSIQVSLLFEIEFTVSTIKSKLKK